MAARGDGEEGISSALDGPMRGTEDNLLALLDDIKPLLVPSLSGV